jgi:hypothetical protein
LPAPYWEFPNFYSFPTKNAKLASLKQLHFLNAVKEQKLGCQRPENNENRCRIYLIIFSSAENFSLCENNSIPTAIPCSLLPHFEQLTFSPIIPLRKRQLFERSEFWLFRDNRAKCQALAASKLFNRAARFSWFVLLTRQKNEQAWS